MRIWEVALGWGAAAVGGLEPSLSSFAADAAVGAVADACRRVGRVGDLGRGLVKACLGGTV